MFLAIVFILFILSSRFLLLNICIFGFLSPYKGVRMCICVFEGGRGVVNQGCWRQRSKGVRGGDWGGFRHSRERGNFTAGLLLRQSG